VVPADGRIRHEHRQVTSRAHHLQPNNGLYKYKY
jgi:hypothetical protein